MKNMAIKLAIVWCIFLSSGLFFTVSTCNLPRTGSSVQDAARKAGRTILKTIYEEQVKDGEIIFFLKNSLDYNKATLAAGYIKKTMSEWEWVCGGEHGTISSACRENGFSAQFFSRYAGTPFPLYFGAVTNPEIEKIRVTELKRNIVSEAKISGGSDLRVWYVFMGNLDGPHFNIKAYSKEGKELSFLNDDISA